MRNLHGSYYTTAFRVLDDDLFAADPAIVEMRKHVDIFQGGTEGEPVYCIASKDTGPQSRLEVLAPAISNLIDGAHEVVEDPLGWIKALQCHLHPDCGIVIDETAGDERVFTYVSTRRIACARL